MVLSIIIPTLNNEVQLIECLKCIKDQTYSKVELIISDGGSVDNTLKIAKEYGAKILNNKDVLAEPGVNLGMDKAEGDLLMVLAVDNYLYDKYALQKVVDVFSDSKIYAAFPVHASKKEYTVFSKYINTFTDPFNHYVYGDAANARTFYRIYSIKKKTSTYIVFNFLSNDTRPVLAFAQGFTVRSDFKRKESDKFDDQKSIIDLIESGKQIAYVFNVELFHDTIRDIGHFIRKQRWATRNAINGSNYGISHRLSTLTKYQQLKRSLWPLYSLTGVFPIFIGIGNAIRYKQLLWLFHPIICIISGYSSILEVIVYNMNSKKRVSRQ